MKTTYVFIADGDLKVFLSELIAKQYCSDGDWHFVTFTPRIKETWQLFDWTSRTCLSWPHKTGLLKKYWRLRERIHEILHTIGNLCEGADRIVIHTYQIFSERINYLVHYLQRRYPHAEVRFRLLPDGTLNLTRRPMTGVRRLPQLLSRVRWWGDPHIRVYEYEGDRLGADAPIVDRIYLPRGFPNEYAPEKVHWLDMPRPTLTHDTAPGRRALVIGTAMTQTKVCTRTDVARVAARIREQLATMGCESIFYKPHHKEPADELELWSPGYEILTTKAGIERMLLTSHFDVLIGLCSTALLTSKLMYEGLNVVCCGLDIVEMRARRGASVHQYRNTCQALGIPVC